MSENNRILILYAASDGQSPASGVVRRLHRDAPQLAVKLDTIPTHLGWWRELTDAIDAADFVLVVLSPDALHDPMLRAKWRYAQQVGKCLLPIITVPELPLEQLPSWKRNRPFYELSLDWHRVVEMLRGLPCETQRIPFMAPNLPAHYINRDLEYETLVKFILDYDRSKPVVITSQQPAIGGFGKTTLATALCYDPRIQDAFPDGILWVDLGETPDVMEELGKIYAALTGEEPGFVDMENAIDQVALVLSDKDCLIVLDSITNAGHLRPFLHGGKRCLRLVTIRDFSLVREGRRINVDMMTMAEALALMNRHFDDLGVDRSYYLVELVKLLGYWTLGMELAARAIRWQVEQGGLPLNQALHLYLNQLAANNWAGFENHREEEYQTLLATVLHISLSLLNEKGELTHTLQLGIFPPSTDVDIPVLATLWNMPFEQALERVRRLDALGIVYFMERHGEIRMHAMIQNYLHDHILDAPALHASLIEAWGDPLKLTDNYAWHWYAYHLVEAGHLKRLEALLTNFDWLQAKLEALNISEVITDFHRAQRVPDDSALAKLSLHYVQGALQLSARVLAQDRQQLAPQLLGRLMHLDDPLIKNMVEQAQRWPHDLWLRPLVPSLIAPGGVMLRTFQHSHAVTALAVTPDSQKLVTGAANGAVILWDMATGEQIRLLGRHEAWVHAIEVTPDGAWAVSASVDHKIAAWSLTGQPPRYFYGHKGPVTSLKLLPDGERFVSVSWDETLKFWNLNTGEVERTLEMQDSWASAIALTPDGRRALTTSQDNHLKVWDLESEVIERTLVGHHDPVRAVALTPDGKWAVSGSEDGTLIIWDWQSGQAEDILTGHTLGINAVTITPDGLFAVSGSEDNTLKIWDLVRGMERRTLIGHEFSVSSVTVTPDGRQVVSASLGGKVILWDMKQDADRRYRHKREVLALALSGQRIASGGGSGTLKVWDIADLQPQTIEDAHPHAVSSLVMTPDGQRLASGDIVGTLKIWNLETGQPEHVLQDEISRGVTALALTQDGQQLICGSSDGSLVIWEMATGQRIRALPGHGSAVRALLVTENHLISGAGDHAIKIWDAGNGVLYHTLEGHNNWVTTLIPLADGKRFVSGGGDGWLHVWNLETGEKTVGWHAHYDWILSLAATDGQIISGAADGTLRVWDTATGQFIRTLSGHTGGIRALNLIESWLVSASADATLRVWDMTTGACTAIFNSENGLRCCAVNPDTMQVVAGSQSGALHVLKVARSSSLPYSYRV